VARARDGHKLYRNGWGCHGAVGDAAADVAAPWGMILNLCIVTGSWAFVVVLVGSHRTGFHYQFVLF